MEGSILEILKSDNDKQINTIETDDDILCAEKENLPPFLQHSPTIIAAAAYYGAVKCYSALIKKGASIYKTDSFDTPISHFSVFGESSEIMQSIHKSGISFSGASCVAAENKKIKSLRWLKEHGLIFPNDVDSRGFNVGLCAALTNDEATIKYVYEILKCFPNKLNDGTNIVLFLLKNNLDKAAELTIKHIPGLNLNEVNRDGESPLSYATKMEKKEIVELIQNRGKEKTEKGDESKEEDKSTETKKEKANKSTCCEIF